AHELGLCTNATILYGHIEDRRERLVHMDMLRRAQDEALVRMGYAGESVESGGGGGASAGGAPVVTLTRPNTPLPARHLDASTRGDLPQGYFQTIIPLPFIPDGSELEHLPGPTGLENLRTLAVARLMLDN